MTTSLFDLYKIGIGPSSSHTMGPMRAAHRFVSELRDNGLLKITERVRADLYGSLALTGKGHGTDRAVLLGLSGEEASSIDPATDRAEAGERFVRALRYRSSDRSTSHFTKSPIFSSIATSCFRLDL